MIDCVIDWRRETSSLGLHLLFVDDEVINRNLFERTAKALGCTADVISDGDEVRLLCIACRNFPCWDRS
jgi:hypothetical protein